MTYTLKIDFTQCAIEDYEFVEITEWEKELILKQYMAWNIMTITDHDDGTIYYINSKNVISLYFDEE